MLGNSLSFEPLISPALWTTLAVVGAVVLVWYARRRPPVLSRGRWAAVITLSAAGMVALLIVLLNPIWLEPIPPPAGKPLLTVLVDRSASMATSDLDGGKSRYGAAVETARSMVDELGSRYEVRVRTFADAAATADAKDLGTIAPDRPMTDLATGIAESLEGDRPQGQAVMVLSDGIHNAPGGSRELLAAARTAKAMNVPLYTQTLGGESRLRDVEVAFGRPQELAFVGQSVPISVMLRQRGAVSDRAELVLSSEGKEVARQNAPLTIDGVSTAHFQVTHDKSGLYRYQVEAAPLQGEASKENNKGTFLLRVVEQPIRVLLLEGKPYWDVKFLTRTLSADPSLELDGVVKLSDSRFVLRRLRLRRPTETPADASPIQRTESTEMIESPDEILTNPEGLAAYQVIVLGRDSEAFLTNEVLSQLRTWISRDGGSLVCYRGSPVSRVDQELARLLPVSWTPARESRFRMRLTGRGQDLSWLTPVAADTSDEVLGKLPSLASVAQPDQPKPLAVVLATSQENEEAPLLTYQSYGTGRVVTVEGAGMWRWAFLAPQFQSHDSVYATLWQSLLRWLVSSVGLIPGQDLALRTDKVTYTVGEPVTAVLLVREETIKGDIPKVELTGAGQAEAKTLSPVPLGDEPGVYRIDVGQLPEGSYSARIVTNGTEGSDASTAIAFDVRQFVGEQLDVAARPDLMARLAAESGGEILDSSDPGQVAQQFQEHMNRSRPERVNRITAWDRWWVLIGILAAWAVAWGLRRAGGLV